MLITIATANTIACLLEGEDQIRLAKEIILNGNYNINRLIMERSSVREIFKILNEASKMRIYQFLGIFLSFIYPCVTTCLILSNIEIRCFAASSTKMLWNQALQKLNNGLIGSDLISKLICPITHVFVEDPVKAADGRSYDRHSIMKWITAHQKLFPDESVPAPLYPLESLANCDIIEDIELKNLINDLKCEVMLTTDDGCASPGTSPRHYPAVFRLPGSFDAADKLDGIGESEVNDRDNLIQNAFEELDRIMNMDLLRSLNLKPPQLVVLGNEKQGKSTLLERLIGFSVFPRNQILCTQCPVRVHLRRRLLNEIPKVSIKDRDGRELETELTSVENISKVVSKKMARILSHYDPGKLISDTMEIVVDVQLSNCPNLDVLDLPGLLAAQPGRNVANQHAAGVDKVTQDLVNATQRLAHRIIKDDKDVSLFLLVVSGTLPTSQSVAVRSVQTLGIAKDTVGAFTFLDLYEPSDGDQISGLKDMLSSTNPGAVEHLSNEWFGIASVSKARMEVLCTEELNAIKRAVNRVVKTAALPTERESLIITEQGCTSALKDAVNEILELYASEESISPETKTIAKELLNKDLVEIKQEGVKVTARIKAGINDVDQLLKSSAWEKIILLKRYHPLTEARSIFARHLGINRLRLRVLELYEGYLIGKWFPRLKKFLLFKLCKLLHENRQLGWPIPDVPQYSCLVQTINEAIESFYRELIACESSVTLKWPLAGHSNLIEDNKGIVRFLHGVQTYTDADYQRLGTGLKSIVPYLYQETGWDGFSWLPIRSAASGTENQMKATEEMILIVNSLEGHHPADNHSLSDLQLKCCSIFDYESVTVSQTASETTKYLLDAIFGYLQSRRIVIPNAAWTKVKLFEQLVARKSETWKKRDSRSHDATWHVSLNEAKQTELELLNYLHAIVECFDDVHNIEEVLFDDVRDALQQLEGKHFTKVDRFQPVIDVILQHLSQNLNRVRLEFIEAANKKIDEVTMQAGSISRMISFEFSRSDSVDRCKMYFRPSTPLLCHELLELWTRTFLRNNVCSLDVEVILTCVANNIETDEHNARRIECLQAMANVIRAYKSCCKVDLKKRINK